MFDSPIDLITLVVAIAAFAFARKAREQVALLRERLNALEAAGATTSPRPVPPAPGAATSSHPLSPAH